MFRSLAFEGFSIESSSPGGLGSVIKSCAMLCAQDLVNIRRVRSKPRTLHIIDIGSGCLAQAAMATDGKLVNHWVVMGLLVCS